nr:4197_t:CDS:2 [Entrophospora candida]
MSLIDQANKKRKELTWGEKKQTFVNLMDEICHSHVDMKNLAKQFGIAEPTVCNVLKDKVITSDIILAKELLVTAESGSEDESLKKVLESLETVLKIHLKILLFEFKHINSMKVDPFKLQTDLEGSTFIGIFLYDKYRGCATHILLRRMNNKEGVCSLYLFEYGT